MITVCEDTDGQTVHTVESPKIPAVDRSRCRRRAARSQLKPRGKRAVLLLTSMTNTDGNSNVNVSLSAAPVGTSYKIPALPPLTLVCI